MNIGQGRLPSRSPIVAATVGDDEPTSQVVVTAVAAVSDVPVLELPPLYDAVEPDALEALFPDGATGVLTFSYNGFLVAVSAAGDVHVYDESA